MVLYNQRTVENQEAVWATVDEFEKHWTILKLRRKYKGFYDSYIEYILSDFMKGYLNNDINLVNWTLLFQVFFTTFVPNYIIVSYSVAPMMEFNKEILTMINVPYDNIYSTIVFIVLVFIIPFLVHNVKWFNTDVKCKEENKFLRKIMFGINSVVDTKKKRFHASKNKDISSSGDFFQEITQPEVQIANICNTITNLMKGFVEDEQIKLSLLMCQDNQFQSYLYLSDESSSVEINDMNIKPTAAKETMKKQKMMIIEDVDNKKKKDVFWKAPNSKIKSVITYPISCGNKATFVVCITSKQSGAFQVKNEKIYQFILDEFSRRILLESYLLEIRKKCQDIN